MTFHSPQGPWRVRRNLILASASPRRQKLLADLGLHFQVTPSAYREIPPSPGVAPEAYAQEMAWNKAQDIALASPDSVILAADTVVVRAGAILGKPKDRTEALAMLTTLCGQTHQVISGCCLLDRARGLETCFAVRTDVHMTPQDPSVLKAYIRTGEPMDKAGSYAIQGSGGFLVASISGSYSNVVGLPLTETLAALIELQAVRPAAESEEDTRERSFTNDSRPLC